MTGNALRRAAAVLGLVALAACATTELETRATLPQPLLEQLPVRVGIYYTKEFRDYVHRESRANMNYSVNLGPAHVTNLNWLMGAMFREVVQVDDPAKIAAIVPPLTFVLEPRFEEYSFLTPKDVAGEAFIVTIRYLLTVYDGGGARVDSFAFTGYGREKSGALANKEPLAAATQRAMRDAGAKIAVELTDQESVRLLLRGAGSPLPASPPQPQPEPFTPAEIPPTTDVRMPGHRWPIGQDNPQPPEQAPADPPPNPAPAEPPPSGSGI